MTRPNEPPTSSDAFLKTRRRHRKSRNGCSVCKKRHMKCDESRPICVNCKIADRESQCIYINIGLRSSSKTSSTATPPPFDLSSFLPLSTSTSLTADESVGSTLASAGDTLCSGELFDLSHFALYHHFLTNRFDIALINPANEEVISVTLECALKAPYLMNQLLAVSALHLSKPPSAQQPYHQLATSLQTRALALFNKVRQVVSEETCQPMFLFSSLVGVHILCDTLQGPKETLGTVLDRFITYLSIHRGVRAVTEQSWNTIKSSKLGPFIQEIEDAFSAIKGGIKSIDILSRMIKSNACPTSAEKYREAICILQRSFSLHEILKESSGRQFDAVLTFCLDINEGYINLLKQRQPEALVILAYFAVLLHWNRTAWIVGNGGQYLIQSITHHLGPHWAEWLNWPNSFLQDTS